MGADPPDPQASPKPHAESARLVERERHQVQVRLVGKTRQAVEAALTLLQTMASVEVQHGPRRGRKGDYLAYATVSVITRERATEEAESEADHAPDRT